MAWTRLRGPGQTPETDIYLALSGDNYEISLAIEYSSKALESLAAEAEEKQKLKDF